MNTVLITGGSSGIGYATAIAFSKKGFQVIATMRNPEKSTALQQLAQQEKLAIDVKQLDVTNEQAVQTVVNNILRDYQKIDILINNAGVGLLGTLEQTSLAQAQNIMDINFFGVWRVTNAVLPSMRRNKSGRIISVTSVGGLLGQPFNDAYCAAKFAVEGMMESLSPVVKRFGIQVALVEPGPVNSEFVASALNQSPTLETHLEKDYRSMLDAYSQATKKVFAELAQKPDEVAEVILAIATSAKPNFRNQTSALSNQIASLKFCDPTGNQGIALSGSRLPDII